MIKLQDFIMACDCGNSVEFAIYVNDAPVMTISNITYNESDKKSIGDVFGDLEIERFNVFYTNDAIIKFCIYVTKGSNFNGLVYPPGVRGVK